MPPAPSPLGHTPALPSLLPLLLPLLPLPLPVLLLPLRSLSIACNMKWKMHTKYNSWEYARLMSQKLCLMQMWSFERCCGTSSQCQSQPPAQPRLHEQLAQHKVPGVSASMVSTSGLLFGCFYETADDIMWVKTLSFLFWSVISGCYNAHLSLAIAETCDEQAVTLPEAVVGQLLLLSSC
jgi:hypothetical protein